MCTKRSAWSAVVGAVLITDQRGGQIHCSGCEECNSYRTLAMKDLKRVLCIARKRRFDTLYLVWKTKFLSLKNSLITVE